MSKNNKIIFLKTDDVIVITLMC